ncbi:hypothetical protein ASD62_02590 [Phycicoccus sp. Root563]|uniref:hypothetical protein n=1 Tax=Phycicoccus sp. Root563 TaxID=1736562 RepID=UPI000702CE9B|nr:hypothetical protein [Phycicoccus sp. Root563]KQZ88376.1 hypothetical protein ASD62_02590 [Phycicoccus sp. Root563]
MTGTLRGTRTVIGAVGLVLGLYGVVRLLGLGWGNLLATVPWLAGVVVVHDGLVAPVIVLVGVAAARVLPTWSRRAALLVLVVLGPLTLLAVPALGRFGAKADNPTLLDRPYAAGWAAVVAVVLVAAAAVAVHDRREGAPRG